MHIDGFRHHFAISLVAFALAAPLAPVWIGPSVATVSAASPLAATLSVLASPVEVANAGPGSFATAIDGQTLFAGDTLRTGPGGMALLTFFDGSESQLGGESQVRVERLEANPAPQIALLQTAGVSVNHVVPMPPGGSFRTETPVATGLVRGTSYIVIVAPGLTCGPGGDQSCTTSMILLTDRNGHVGRVDVKALGSSAESVQLASAGDAAAASRSTTTAARMDSAALAQLEAVAHVGGDPTASRTTEQAARAIAARLADQLVVGTTPDGGSGSPLTLETISAPSTSSAAAIGQESATSNSGPGSGPATTLSQSVARTDNHSDNASPAAAPVTPVAAASRTGSPPSTTPGRADSGTSTPASSAVSAASTTTSRTESSAQSTTPPSAA
jgi:hypothetical protein